VVYVAFASDANITRALPEKRRLEMPRRRRRSEREELRCTYFDLSRLFTAGLMGHHRIQYIGRKARRVKPEGI
jgi:hypothetical protein